PEMPPRKPASGYTKQLHRLSIPEAVGLVQRFGLDGYHDHVNLSDTSFSSTRQHYTKWADASAGSTKKLIDKIGEAIEKDQKQMLKGKTHAPNGAPYASRMLAFRHMLDWAEQDYRESKVGDDVSEYDAKLKEAPPRKRLTEVKSVAYLSGKPFTMRVVERLTQADASAHLGGFRKYRDLMSGGKRLDNEDKRFVHAYHQQVLQKIKGGGYSDKDLRRVLGELSSEGIGTLTPDEFLGLAEKEDIGQLNLSRKDMAEKPSGPVLTGDRGGRYRLTSSGNKQYLGKAGGSQTMQGKTAPDRPASRGALGAPGKSATMEKHQAKASQRRSAAPSIAAEAKRRQGANAKP
ncbi:MAG TPA: hypothetical protein PJ982_10960, partial [Lacipirellulaceae bacterium]|nr:hypothetical protein [Lacipirellulaceae bacterium]